MGTVMPFAFYGTLMDDGGFRGSVLAPFGTMLGPCRIPGRLYSVGAFPALVHGDGVVHGQLWAPDPARYAEITEVLDQIEGYWPDNHASSHYVRETVQLIEPDTLAWVYVYNCGTDQLKPIPSGRWREYQGLLP